MFRRACRGFRRLGYAVIIGITSTLILVHRFSQVVGVVTTILWVVATAYTRYLFPWLGSQLDDGTECGESTAQDLIDANTSGVRTWRLLHLYLDNTLRRLVCNYGQRVLVSDPTVRFLVQYCYYQLGLGLCCLGWM